MVGRRRKDKEEAIKKSIISLKERQGSLQEDLRAHLESEGISISKKELAGLLIKMTKKGDLSYDKKTRRYKMNSVSNPRSSSMARQQQQQPPQLSLPYELTEGAIPLDENQRPTRAAAAAQAAEEAKQLAQQVSHPSEASLRIMRDNSLLENTTTQNLLALIYFEFRCTLFKKGDTIKLFNNDASQWNTCTLASNSFQGNVVNKPECKGGPKYIESKYNVEDSPLVVRPPPKEGGKFINLLKNLYPFESCYSSDRGKVTFINIPEKLDFFVTDRRQLPLLLQQGRVLLQRWEEWCRKSAQGMGSALTHMNGTPLTPANWDYIKNWGLQEVYHAKDSSIPTDVTPSGPSAALYYPSGTEDSNHLDITMSGLTQPGGGNTRLTPRAPAIIWLYNNADIGQEILGYFDTGNGMEIYDMTGNKINQNQISSHGKGHFSKTGIETQLYRQLYILTSKQDDCGGAALAAIDGIRTSSIIGIDGSSSTDRLHLGDQMSIRSESIVIKSGPQQYSLNPFLIFDKKDKSALKELKSQQSYFGAFNLPNAQYTISPGIWIIVDIPRMPHSILVILKGGKKFTIGAGYRDAPQTGIPGRSGSAVQLLIYSPDTSIYSAEEAGQRAQQFDQRLDYEMTKHQHIRMIGPYTPEIESRLQEIIKQASTKDGGSITQGGKPEFMTKFTMPVSWKMYQTLPVTPGTMNCTSLTLWITNQRNITGVCAPGGIYAQLTSSSGASGTAAMGTMRQYAPTAQPGQMGFSLPGGRRKRTKRRRKRKTKRKRHGRKRVNKTRGKKKRRGNRKRRTRR